MKIKFKEMEAATIPHFKGGEGDFIAKMHTDDLNKIINGRLQPGCTIGLHTHETNSEIIFIVSGTADFIYDDGKETVEAGNCHYCPKGQSHSMINYGTEDIVFYAVVPEH